MCNLWFNAVVITDIHPFLRALDLVGKPAMAEALQVSPQMISKMAKLAANNRYYLVPSNHLRSIERVTDGRVSVVDLVLERPAGSPASDLEPKVANA